MLTVLIATRNGENTLVHMLPAYCALQPPRGGWKLVIVDNGSTDSTKNVLQSFTDRLPLTYLFEPVGGKSRALNTGLQSIEGDLVVFADDDAVPRSDWLLHLRRAADEHPSIDIFGGLVLPRWQVVPPQWILDKVPLGPTYTLTAADLAEGPTDSFNIFGPNMAIRTRVFNKGYRFDVSFGPNGSDYPMGSESSLVQRLIREGYFAWHVRDAIVEHLIRQSQTDPSWILQRAVRYGRGEYRRACLECWATVPRWLGIPRYLYRQAGRLMLRLARSYTLGNTSEIFITRWDFNRILGQMIESRRIFKREKRLAINPRAGSAKAPVRLH